MTIHHYSLNAAVPPECRGGVLAIGNFDGVHLGHQALLAKTVEQARRLGGPAVAVTLDPHPLQLLRPESFQPLLTTIDDRAELMQGYGASHVLILKTTPALLQLGARAFFDQIVRQRLEARGMVEGYNFAFGRNREGTLDVLRQLCEEASVALTLLDPQAFNGKAVSSSRVRNELLAGAVQGVCELLNRPYRLSGIVGVGQRRGATLGFPTANLEQVQTLVPGNGVYAVRALHEGKSWPAAANVGPNPTFGEQARKIEVHLIGFTGDLYGQKLGVEFIEKLRDTKQFAHADELIAQVRGDVSRAKRVLRPEASA
jgi:riboflavin kinase/FMN adenylyltransferase